MSGFSSNVKVYDADQVSLTIAGIPISSGYADGVFLEIEQMAEDFTTKVGTDGEVTRSKTNDARVKVKIHLMQSSDGNSLLSVVNTLDKQTPNGGGIGPLLIKDLQGTSLYACAKSWISKPPDAAFDREASERVWEVTGVLSARLDGGN